MLRNKTCGEIRTENIGEEVVLCGWIARRRDHGGLIFVDLRDRYGITQIVFDPEIAGQAHQKAEKIRSEFVIQIWGKVQKRAPEMENKNLPTGEIEIFATKIKILNASKTPPFEIETQKEVREDLRLEFRYLDLRREKMQQNLILRAKMVQKIRNYFSQKDFLEIETPILIKGTPEGSREYLVPARLHQGKFYVLPQSPQQLKQLLMVAGIDKYFQVPRCFRDEDQRGDRQPEFTQFEIEMSFPEQKDILEIVEGCFFELNKNFAQSKNWEKFLQNGKFQKTSWQQAMEKYGIDKPDLRFGLEFHNLSEITKNSGFTIFEKAKFLFGLPITKELAQKITRKNIDDLTEIARKSGAGGLAWIRIGENSGPVAKNSTPEFLTNLQKICNAEEGDLIFFGASEEFIKAVEPLGQVRLELGNILQLKNKNDFAYCWVTDFPMFEKNDAGEIGAVHHPFTRPHPEDEEKINSDPLNCRACAYDLVLNGVELGGGSLRIHERNLQKKIFDILKISDQDAERRFGHMLRAFEYGAPPHGGIAMGLDRVIMLFADEPNIREVIAFPKNQNAQDLMLGAPGEMPKDQLDELGIEINEK